MYIHTCVNPASPNSSSSRGLHTCIYRYYMKYSHIDVDVHIYIYI